MAHVVLLLLFQPPERETVVTTVTLTEPEAREHIHATMDAVVEERVEEPAADPPEPENLAPQRVAAVIEPAPLIEAVAPEPVQDIEAEEVTAEDVPPEEPEPDQAEEDLRAVFQPDRNSEAPDQATALAEFDNSTDVETMPEDVVAEAEQPGQPQEIAGGDESPTEEDTTEPPDDGLLDDSDGESAGDSALAENEVAPLGDESGTAEVNDEGVDAQDAEEAQAAVEAQEEPSVEPEMVPDGLEPAPERSPLDRFRPQAALEVAERLAQQGRAPAVARGVASGHADAAYHEVFGERDERDVSRVARAERQDSIVGDHDELWEHTRHALENYDVAVTPGSEVSLNTRSDAAAAYIHYLHNRIHERWWAYLEQWTLYAGPNSPLSDYSLVAELEFGIRSDGEVDRVSIADGSGSTQFDGSAVAMLWALSPHRAPPPGLIGSDGNVYVRWSFHRDNRGCISSGASVHRVQSSAHEGG